MMKHFVAPPNHMDSIIETDRLFLRQWREADLEPFAALNADPRVMEYFSKLRSREESDAQVRKESEEIDRRGWGLWAVSLKLTDEFIGFIGLTDPDFGPRLIHAVEIGWRLAFRYWGHGYATEGAQAALRYGFETLKREEVVACTATHNRRSRAVMERLGMRYRPEDDFDHPRVPEGHPLRRHVLYRLSAIEWRKRESKTTR